MTRRLARFGLVGIIPTTVDVGLLVVFRLAFGWILVLANLAAITCAAVVSYWLHRRADFGGNPYTRWVRYPWAFAWLALIAALIDTLVLRIAFAATGFDDIRGLLWAKAFSLTAAVAVRAISYRFVLSGTIRESQRHHAARHESSGRHRASVVIPAYREPDRIATTVSAIRSEFRDLGADLEIILVDDGSGDRTADAALDAGADQVIVLPENRGKGAAVRAGMLASRGRAVAFTDADLAYDPPQLRRVLDTIEQGWDVAIGNRQHADSVLDGGGGLRSIGSRIVNRLAQAVLLARPADTQCGLKGFRGDVARDLFARTRVDGFAFDIEVLHIVERDELSLCDLPVHLVDPGGGSTVRIVQDVLRLILDLFRVRQWSRQGRYDPADVSVDH